MRALEDKTFSVADFFEVTPDFVCIAGKDGYFRKVNKSVIEKLEYSQEELFAVPIATFVHPDDKVLTRQTREELINGKALLNFVNRYISKSGKIIWLEWTSIYFADEELVFAIAKDVSARKRMEVDVEAHFAKLKGLADHFKTSIEDDRKLFATELHEELAQMASIVKMDVDWLSANIPDLSEQAKGRMDHALAVSEMLVKSIRRISFSISPNMLEDMGLTETLRWHCTEFTLFYSIPCYFEGLHNEEGISKEIKIDFFRICQEALNNIASHSDATEVTIQVEKKEERVSITISDNGKGFDISVPVSKGGIVRMRERAASINGLLTIHSEPGTGTRVNVTVSEK